MNKNSDPEKNKKTIQKGFVPVVLVFIVLGVIIVGGIAWYYSWILKYQAETDEAAAIYYGGLERECETIGGRSCCRASVNSMKVWGSVLADDKGECPVGYVVETLECVGAYKWCVYVGNSDGKDKRIGNFDDCVKSGYPILETNPPQCKTDDGRTFIESQSEQ